MKVRMIAVLKAIKGLWWLWLIGIGITAVGAISPKVLTLLSVSDLGWFGTALLVVTKIDLAGGIVILAITLLGTVTDTIEIKQQMTATKEG